MNCNSSEIQWWAGCRVSEAGACQRAIAQTETCTDDWLIGGQEGKTDLTPMIAALSSAMLTCLDLPLLEPPDADAARTHNSHVKHE